MPFSKLLDHFVEFKHILLIGSLLESLTEILGLLLSVEVQNSQLSLRKHNLDGIKSYFEILGDERFASLDKGVGETMHNLTLIDVLVFITEELFALNDSPVLFELVLGVADVAECLN